MISSPKDARLVARTSSEVQALIRNAAELLGVTQSQFLIDAATTKAVSIIEQSQRIQLSLADAESIFSAIDTPPTANEKLQTLAQKYKDQIRDAKD